jgi:hypothetical protein
MAGKGSRDTRVKDRKKYKENFDAIKFREKNDEGFVKIKGKLVKKY